MSPTPPRIALVYPGDLDARRHATPQNSRFLKLFDAFARLGAHAEPAVYHDDFCDEVRAQLAGMDAVLVWVNPFEGGRDRTQLDAMLRAVAATGVYVSAHPDTILKLGTKEILYTTRDFGWGCDTHCYATPGDMARELPARLDSGARVLKQYRGQSGDGVWKVERDAADGALVRVRHAKRGSPEETMPLADFVARCVPYFESHGGQGRMIDQAWQPRLPEGMIRCYVVVDRVEGFGHQAINMLYPPPAGAPPDAAPLPGPRLYHPPTLPEFQSLKHQLEAEWVPQLQQRLNIARDELPALWDCDFLLGPKTASGADTYVLCEINVSSVSPFPDTAVLPLARAVLARIGA